LFGIAFEPLYGTEVTAIQLAPLGPECAEDSTGCTNEMLVCSRHYR
jgi:hypothetical protein